MSEGDCGEIRIPPSFIKEKNDWTFDIEIEVDCGGLCYFGIGRLWQFFRDSRRLQSETYRDNEKIKERSAKDGF